MDALFNRSNHRKGKMKTCTRHGTFADIRCPHCALEHRPSVPCVGCGAFSETHECAECLVVADVTIEDTDPAPPRVHNHFFLADVIGAR